MPELAIIADDLSGAAEAAAALLLRTPRISVGLRPGAVRGRRSDRVVAIDTDSRRRDAPGAAARVRSALLACQEIPVIKKADSLLRGNLATEVRTLHELYGVPPVVATALPGAGRTVVEGVLRIGGVPLHETGLWHAERLRVPRNVADALAPLPTALVPLATVRDLDALPKALAEAAAAGLVAICDAETDADLDAVHAAAHQLHEQPVLVGSGGLAAAAARALAPDGPVATAHSVAENVLVVVGSAAPSLAIQLDRLATVADVVLRLDPDELLAGAPDLAASVRGARRAVVSLAPGVVRPQFAPRLAAALAAAVAPIAADRNALVLTGGETARGVLDLLGVDRLAPVAERCGAVLSRAGGRIVVTRPGSFGGPTSLADLVTSLFTVPTPEEPT